MFIVTSFYFVFLQSELEDLSFMYSHPDAYTDLKKRVEEVYNEHEEEALEVRIYDVPKIIQYIWLRYICV